MIKPFISCLFFTGCLALVPPGNLWAVSVLGLVVSMMWFWVRLIEQ